MTIQEQMKIDLKAALKAGNQLEAVVLRSLNAAIHNREIEIKAKTGKNGLTEEEVIHILAREAKKQKEAIELYRAGGRPVLAEKEEQELRVIKRFLPPEMSKEEIETAVNQIISREGAGNFGEAMKAVMQDLKGRADAAAVSEAVRKKLGNAA